MVPLIYFRFWSQETVRWYNRFNRYSLLSLTGIYRLA